MTKKISTLLVAGALSTVGAGMARAGESVPAEYLGISAEKGVSAPKCYICVCMGDVCVCEEVPCS